MGRKLQRMETTLTARSPAAAAGCAPRRRQRGDRKAFPTLGALTTRRGRPRHLAGRSGSTGEREEENENKTAKQARTKEEEQNKAKKGKAEQGALTQEREEEGAPATKEAGNTEPQQEKEPEEEELH